MRTAGFVHYFGLLLLACAICAMAQNHPPTALIKVVGMTITSNQIRVSVNQNVCFDGLSSSDPDNDALTYSWDFGDGTAKSTAAAPCHAFSKSGLYSVKLTVDDGYVDPSTKSLLAGMTPTNYTLPAGWRLVLADGAENGIPSGVVLGSNVCTTGSNNSLGFPYAAHTGSHSYCGLLSGDGTAVEAIVGLPNGYHQVYISMWDYADPDALYGNSDYEYVGVVGRGGDCGQVNIQAQTGDINIGSSVNGEYWPVHAYNGANCSDEYFWYNGPMIKPSPPIDAGVWKQFEMLYIPNSTFSSTLNPPPGNCTSTTQAGCGNGTLKIWVNGVLSLDAENANLNAGNLADMTTNAQAVIGGYITSFGPTSTGPEGRCTTFSMTGGGTCPGAQPGIGGPKPFYRYLDDIIVLTK